MSARFHLPKAMPAQAAVPLRCVAANLAAGKIKHRALALFTARSNICRDAGRSQFRC